MKTVQSKQLQELWQQRINDWQQSGLSQTQWYKQHQLNTNQLGYWKRKYAQKSESKVTPLAIATPKPDEPPKTR
ncbi:MAG: IS66 family insertion sequence element accessory protein TnpA, partial [Endozoicomonas sp.]